MRMMLVWYQAAVFVLFCMPGCGGKGGGDDSDVDSDVQEEDAVSDPNGEDTGDGLPDTDEEDGMEEGAWCGNGLEEVGEECDDGNEVSGDGCEPGTCTYSCHDDGECDDGLGCTDDVCDTDATHTCSHPASAGGTVCRPAAGPCDVEEACNGTGESCPADAFQPDTVECRASVGQCDVAEHCPGDGAACPADAFVPAGTTCDDGHLLNDPDECDGLGSCTPTGPGELWGLTAASAGGIHTCALHGTHGLWCWGSNYYGQLGDGTNEDRIIPAAVSGLASDAAAVAAGRYHTCALLDSGGVQCWGRNEFGQLGASTADRNTPIDVVGLSSGVTAVSSSGEHACALLGTGGVKCWGHNGFGQLGDGTTTNSTTPVDVLGLGSSVTAVSAGFSHTCALLDTGGIQCWGGNASGELGNGTTTASPTPVDVVGLSSGVTAVSGGWGHTCALLGTGGVKCWGQNISGQLGDGTTTFSSTPVDVLGLSSGVAAITAGTSRTCAILDTGGVRCWGRNWTGELGDGTNISRETPVDVVGLASGVAAVTVGEWHTCALLATGGLWCWGSNFYGELGDGTTWLKPTPENVPGLTSGTVAVAAGRGYTCALRDTGAVQCWGQNNFGQLGDGTTLNTTMLVDVVGLSSSAADVAAGGEFTSGHTCALLDTGGVQCWGGNEYGEIGDGTTTQRTTPVSVSGLTYGVASIGLGANHTCALRVSGGLRCWGRNSSGQIGDGTASDRLVPVDVTGLTGGVAAVDGGQYHTCALTITGGAKCWGANSYGQLGNGTTTGTRTPADVSGLSSGVSVVKAGDNHTCALMDTGGVQCWGSNLGGQLGDGTTTLRSTSVDVSGLSSGVSAIAVGGSHTCALMSTGGMKCWGSNSSGCLGDGTFLDKTAPVDVLGLASGVSAIAAGDAHTCALLDTGSVMCWGTDNYGQVSGFFSGYPHPVVVCD